MRRQPPPRGMAAALFLAGIAIPRKRVVRRKKGLCSALTTPTRAAPAGKARQWPKRSAWPLQGSAAQLCNAGSDSPSLRGRICNRQNAQCLRVPRHHARRHIARFAELACGFVSLGGVGEGGAGNRDRDITRRRPDVGMPHAEICA